MKVNCQDYRTTMQLLSLKKKLEKGITDSEEEKEVKRLIRKIEAKVDVD